LRKNFNECWQTLFHLRVAVGAMIGAHRSNSNAQEFWTDT